MRNNLTMFKAVLKNSKDRICCVHLLAHDSKEAVKLLEDEFQAQEISMTTPEQSAKIKPFGPARVVSVSVDDRPKDFVYRKLAQQSCIYG